MKIYGLRFDGEYRTTSPVLFDGTLASTFELCLHFESKRLFHFWFRALDEEEGLKQRLTRTPVKTSILLKEGSGSASLLILVLAKIAASTLTPAYRRKGNALIRPSAGSRLSDSLGNNLIQGMSRGAEGDLRAYAWGTGAPLGLTFTSR